MSLKHALLGFLTYGEMTGYDLKQFFDQSIQHFWPANLSQIYPTLNQMEKDGLLTMHVEYQEKLPPKKVYCITKKGATELNRWLSEPLELQPNRNAFLIKIFFGSKMKKEELVSLLKDNLEKHQAQLTSYQGPIQDCIDKNKADTGLGNDAAFWGLTLRAGILHEKAWIQWLEEAIAVIEKGGNINYEDIGN